MHNLLGWLSSHPKYYDSNDSEVKRTKELTMSNQKLLQHDIERELEGLTFNELIQIAMLINEMYSKSNGKPTLIFNMFNYTKESEQ